MVVMLQVLNYTEIYVADSMPDPLPDFTELDLPGQKTILMVVVAIRNGQKQITRLTFWPD